MKALVAALAALLLLAGCSLSPQQRELSSAEKGAAYARHEAQILGIESFQVDGRAASAELGFRADLHWLERADRHFELRLAGPFGAGAVELRGDADLVEVRNSDGVQQTADPEGWIRHRYGWTLPISGLRYWALGVPNPRIPSQPSLDAQGRLETLIQNGWKLTYSEYRREGEYDLPRRFEADNGQVRLKLLIDRWNLQPEIGSP
ncbi:lipoprotein insertase outer membrane protein LolB [Hydrocarboniphaga effusa]|uniref:Outer-membrane lipoprotein LolB n=1 Tax=Hydrocarboniphaga effusa AP103 TaxID=1172194 RepID=I8T831_9GAMM|nr:lipoprotein insertase outer membrane protein LolB [Hydrocarboniphaga effusa]EIT69913.1 hypothetical protein WQQ_00500 [Hydrocarboniphaga effusa AP103]EIT70100.1 hypothetical protein WQQ_02370 [Hydrocarboniphaga effusa AP103]